jgi:hypothetical protein
MILTLGVGLGVLSWLANRSAFFPMKYPQGEWEAQGALGTEDVWMDSGGTRLHGWWKDAPGAQAVILFLHGNAGNVSHRGVAMEDLTAAGAAVLVIDYRGYGKSEGWPTERGLYRDAEAGYEWLRRRGWAEDRIILQGESLGTTVAVDLAARRKCAGVVLEAPFPSARAVAARVLPLLGPALVWGFDARAKIGRVRAPMLFIHGDRDEVIAYELGKELYAAAPKPKEFWTVAGGHHNDLHFVNPSTYRARLREFMINACNAAVSLPPQQH